MKEQSAQQRAGAFAPSKQGRRTRIRIRQVHLWLGLLVGAHLLVMGLSGSALVFREEWNAGLEPVISHEPRPALHTLAAAISSTLQREVTGYTLSMLVVPGGGRPLRATLQQSGAKPVWVYLDPATAAILARTDGPPLPDRLADFHHNLLVGRTGRVINGLIAIIFLLLVASGLWLWVTQTRPLPLRLSVRCSNLRRAVFDMHTATGFWLSPFFVLMAFTAIYFAWHEPVASVINLITLSTGPKSAPRAGTSSCNNPLGMIVAAAAGAMPEGALSYIQYPERLGDPVVVRMKHRGEWHSNGSSHVYLQPCTAAVLMSDRTSDRPLGTRIVRNLAPVHFGEFGGLPTRMAWLVLGLAPGLLFFTGFLIWRKKAI